MIWSKYPENLPNQDGEYIITLEGGHVTVADFQKHTKLYNKDNEKYFGPAWHDLQEGGMHRDVIAFKTKPTAFSAWTLFKKRK